MVKVINARLRDEAFINRFQGRHREMIRELQVSSKDQQVTFEKRKRKEFVKKKGSKEDGGRGTRDPDACAGGRASLLVLCFVVCGPS